MSAARAGRPGRRASFVFIFIRIVAQTSRCGKLEFADHKVSHCIADGQERRAADDKMNDIRSNPCLQRHGHKTLSVKERQRIRKLAEIVIFIIHHSAHKSSDNSHKYTMFRAGAPSTEVK